METIKVQDKETDTRPDNAYVARLCNITGLLVSVALVIYFLVMKAFELQTVTSLRHFNAVFIIAGIITAFSLYKRKNHGIGIDYFKGLKMGVWITFVAYLPFSIFMLVYLHADKEFMSYIQGHIEYGSYATPALAAGGVFIEGMIGGGILTFMAMQYFKRELVCDYEKKPARAPRKTA